MKLDFPIQVYGSPTPVDAQRAWVHLLAEAHLLAQAKPGNKEAVRALKLAGMREVDRGLAQACAVRREVAKPSP